MIPTTVSRSGIVWNGLLESILETNTERLEARLGRIDPIGALKVRLWWDGTQCRCRLNLRVPGETLSAGAEHLTADLALHRAFEAFFRRVERKRSALLDRRHAA